MGQTKLNEEQVDLTSYKKAEQTTAEISAAVQTHNTAGDAHADIRTTLAGKAEQTDLEAHTADTDNPHSVTKAQVGLGNVDNTADADKPVSSAVQAALERKQDDDEFHPEDYGWPDIRPAARPNAIVLLAGVKADFSDYDNLGFTATCEGGYNVFIDGVQYGDTYASGEQCSITWSQYSATTGFSVSYPVDLIAHIVQIVPATYGNTISAYTSNRIASSGIEQQGILWAHFNLNNIIALYNAFSTYNTSLNSILLAITSASDTLKVSSISGMLGQSTDLYSKYSTCAFLPVLDLCGGNMPGGGAFNTNGIKKIKIKNGTINQLNALFSNNTALQKIEIDNVQLQCDPSAFGGYVIDNFLVNANSLQELPVVDMTHAKRAYPFISNATYLKDTYLDFGYADKLQRLGLYGWSQYPIRGLKTLLVSNKAPFDFAGVPQINVAYTGLDQAALVALFKSLPYNVGYDVVGNPTIQDGVVSGFTANDLLSVSGKFAYSAITEMVIKFRVNSSFLGTQKYTNILSTPQLVLYGNTSDFSAIFNIPGIGDIGLGKVSPDTDYWVKYLNDGTTVSSWISENGSSWTQKDSKDSTGLSTDIISRTLYFGGRGIGDSGRPAFDGSIDLAKSYIKISGVPWFRGAAAMEKTINITGATGAAALTSEQLAIATDKGWTVTR